SMLFELQIWTTSLPESQMKSAYASFLVPQNIMESLFYSFTRPKVFYFNAKKSHLYLHHPLTLQIRPLVLHFISQHSKQAIVHQNCHAQTPHQRDCIKEVRITATGVYPQVVERWAEERSVEEGGGCEEGVSHKGKDMCVETEKREV